MRRDISGITIALACLTLASCHDMGSNPFVPVVPPPPPPTKSVSFQNDVLPILENYGCTSCHGGTAGLTVGTVAGLEAGGLHGPAIVPGNADGSNIVRKISPNPPFGARMPQGGPYLDAATIQVIKDWINQGALDN
jgi:hypothetical protein